MADIQRHDVLQCSNPIVGGRGHVVIYRMYILDSGDFRPPTFEGWFVLAVEFSDATSVPVKALPGFSGQGDVTLLGRRGARTWKLPSTSVLFQVFFILSSDSAICVFFSF